MTIFTYHLKLQAQGRVVVPTDVRSDLGISEGEELILVKEEYGYRLTSRKLLAQSLYGSLKLDGEEASDLTEELLEERQAEAEARGW